MHRSEAAITVVPAREDILAAEAHKALDFIQVGIPNETHDKEAYYTVFDFLCGALLVVGAPCQLKTLAGQEHGRTIPLADPDRLPRNYARRPLLTPSVKLN
jgi:hypothetical protein